MFHRPLIPIFFSFLGGILIGHNLLSSCPETVVPISVLLASLLTATLFISPRLKIHFFLSIFFLAGIMLDLNEHSPSKLLPYAIKREKVTIEGTILEPIKIVNKMAKIKVRTNSLFIDDREILVQENIIVTVYNHVPHLSAGEKIRFPAGLKPFKNFNNPGRFDYESFMKLKGLSCAASVSDGRYLVQMGPGHLPFPRGLLEKMQHPIREFFKTSLTDREFSLYRALILGERQGICKELREPFNRTGLGHVLAVSGLHVGMVAVAAFFLFKWLLSRSYNLTLKIDILRLTALLTCIPVIGYALLAGLHVSTQRAMIMCLAFLWSLILRREKEVWSTLALAGLIILAIDPNALFNISFQLSFFAVIGILWLTPPIMSIIPDMTQEKKRFFNRLFVYFAGIFAVSLSATVFLIPLTSFYFHRVSLVAVPANITIVPFLGIWIIPLGILAALIFPLFPQTAHFILQLGAWGLDAMTEITRFWSGFSWSSLWVATPNALEILMFYVLILFLFFFKRSLWAKTGFLALTVFILCDVGCWMYKVRFNNHLKVTYLDVGQANAALVEFPGGKKMLIDGGGFYSGQFDVGRMVVAPYLWHSKIRHIDYLVLSHPQADHMNGLRFIAGSFHPEEFWHNGDEVETGTFKELMAIIKEKEIKRLLPADLVGGRQINGVTVEILQPAPDTRSSDFYNEKTGLNNNSLVLKITYKGKAFLFPGDLEQAGEEVLVANAGVALKSDILLSPHHGSKNSSTEAFLKMVRPDICVISSGEGNFFGFPHEQTLKRLKDIGCRAIKIARTGAVQCIVGSDEFKVRTFIEDSSF